MRNESSAMATQLAPEAGTCRPRLQAACKPSRAQSRRRALGVVAAANKQVTLLDYGAGNVRSVRNAIKALGWDIKDVSRAQFHPSPGRRPSTAPAYPHTRTRHHFAT